MCEELHGGVSTPNMHACMYIYIVLRKVVVMMGSHENDFAGEGLLHPPTQVFIYLLLKQLLMHCYWWLRSCE